MIYFQEINYSDDNMMKLSHGFLKYNPSSVSMDSTDYRSKYTKNFRKF